MCQKSSMESDVEFYQIRKNRQHPSVFPCEHHSGGWIKTLATSTRPRVNSRGRRCGIKTQDWPAGATSTRPRANARGRRCGIKTQDWPAGATSTRPRANARGWRCGIKTLDWPAGASLTKNRRHYPGPKMWNQDPRVCQVQLATLVDNS